MTTQAFAIKEFQADECSLAPVSIYIANLNQLTCCDYSSVHRHNRYEIMWLPKGRMTFYLDFTSYELEEGTLMFIAPGQIHT